MAKAENNIYSKSNCPDKYEERLVVNGSLKDIIKAAVKHKRIKVVRKRGHKKCRFLL